MGNCILRVDHALPVAWLSQVIREHKHHYHQETQQKKRTKRLHLPSSASSSSSPSLAPPPPPPPPPYSIWIKEPTGSQHPVTAIPSHNLDKEESCSTFSSEYIRKHRGRNLTKLDCGSGGQESHGAQQKWWAREGGGMERRVNYEKGVRQQLDVCAIA